MEQLVDQWLAVEKDITIPGTEVNKIREDIKKKSGTDSRDERPTEARDHKTIAGLQVPAWKNNASGNIFGCPENAISADSATFASNARCNSECINTVQKARYAVPASGTKSWVHWGRNLINALCNRSALIDSGATGTF